MKEIIIDKESLLLNIDDLSTVVYELDLILKYSSFSERDKNAFNVVNRLSSTLDFVLNSLECEFKRGTGEWERLTDDN